MGAPPQTARLLRDRSGVQRVTNIELFFDLVYVFAITQLSHYLLGHADLRGAPQAGRSPSSAWPRAPRAWSPRWPPATGCRVCTRGTDSYGLRPTPQ
jgi:hypothetical protein